MSNVNFGSTYKIPLNQWGINNTKKLQLKSIAGSYNGIVTKGKDSCAILSIPDKKDLNFIRKLRKLGFFEFKQFEGEKIPKMSLEEYVKNMVNKKG